MSTRQLVFEIVFQNLSLLIKITFRYDHSGKHIRDFDREPYEKYLAGSVNPIVVFYP